MSKTAQRKRSALQSGYKDESYASSRRHRFNGSYKLGQYVRKLQARNARTEGVQA